MSVTVSAQSPAHGPGRGGESVGDRLEMGCAAHQLTLRELGQIAGLPANRIYLIKAGRSPATPHATAIAHVLGCDSAWLATGAGPQPAWGRDYQATILKRSSLGRHRAGPPLVRISSACSG